MSPSNARRTGYVLKVYPRFSETFIVTEILAREAAGESLQIFALRHSTDARFHPELARVQAPVTFVPKPLKLSDAWELVGDATRTVPGFADRYAALLPELAGYDPTEVHQGIALATSAARSGLTHLHAHFGSLAGRTAELAAELAGITFSVTTHAKDLFHESVDRERLGTTLRRASHTVTISRFNLEHLARHYPDLAERTHLLYNGLELARFPFREPRVPGERLRIAAVGRLVEKKGFAQLIDAVAALAARGVAADVRIAGDGELRAGLAAHIARLGLEPAGGKAGGPFARQAGNTAALLGPQTQAEVRALLDWADVFAAPCTVGADGNADGLPTVLLEALAIGVTCVATAVTGIPEAVVNGNGTPGSATGILIDPDDAGALVRALVRTADPAFPRRDLARAGRALVERRFDSAAQARALARLEDGAAPGGAVAAQQAGAPNPAELADPAELAEVADLTGVRVAYACVDPGIPFFGTKGASVHVQEIVRALRARGATVRLYCTRAGGHVPADLADVQVTELRIPPGTTAVREAAQLAASREMAGRIAADGADLVYERYSLFSTVLATLAEAEGIPGVLEVNAPLIDEQRTHRELVLEDHSWRALSRQVGAAARTVCVSGPVADWVLGHADASAARRVRVVANGVNTARIRPGDRGSRPRADAGPTVVFVGTLKPWHGVETLVDAVARSAGDWRLEIVGDGPLAEALRARAAAHGPSVRARIDFAGAVEPERIGALLARADIAVAPYPAAAARDAYFSPLKIYEYLAAGLPVVASRVGQIPGIVADGRTGVLVEPSDAGALARALDALAADPARRATLGGNARAEAVAEHGWERVLERALGGLDLVPVADSVPAGASL